MWDLRWKQQSNHGTQRAKQRIKKKEEERGGGEEEEEQKSACCDETQKEKKNKLELFLLSVRDREKKQGEREAI